MTTFRSDETLVGIVAFGLVGWIGSVLYRGLRDARLPIGRGYVDRSERPGAFHVLTGFYMLSALAALVISLDLLLGLGGWA